MGKRTTVEDTMARLAALRQGPVDAGAVGQLSAALGDKTNLVVARAADVTAHLRITTLNDAMGKAFERFMEQPDRGCAAKTAIVRALNALGAATPAVYLRGIRHVQNEPGYGGPTDSAIELRGTSALGLAQMGYRDVLFELTDLLMDAQAGARVAAARAMALAGSADGALLLRLKLLAGDKEPEVIAECVAAILALAPEKNLGLVEEFLDSPDEALAEAVAISIGDCRHPAAFAVLKARYESHPVQGMRRILIDAMGLLRLPESIEFLVSLVEGAAVESAAQAIHALRLHRNDAKVRGRVEAAVALRDKAGMREAMGKWQHPV